MGEVTPPRPLAKADNRSQFDCGRESLNVWFQRHAWANHEAGISRTSVICNVATSEIVGYVSLSAAQIERAFLPKSDKPHKPDPVPVTLLGQLAIHKDRQREGHASSLLRFALRTALRASRDIGSFGVIAHPVDDQVRAFYARWGFRDLPFDPRRSMLVRMADLERSVGE